MPKPEPKAPEPLPEKEMPKPEEHRQKEQQDLLIRFLDAESNEERLELLGEMKTRISETVFN